VPDLRQQAEHCRQLAKVVDDERNYRLLLEMAARLEDQADRINRDAIRRSEFKRPSLTAFKFSASTKLPDK
jgi:hypothetical protein